MHADNYGFGYDAAAYGPVAAMAQYQRSVVRTLSAYYMRIGTIPKDMHIIPCTFDLSFNSSNARSLSYSEVFCLLLHA